MTIRRATALVLSTAAGLGSACLLASPASAVTRSTEPELVLPAVVQFQSYQRATKDAPCPHQPWETPWQSAWDASGYDWNPSWAQWPNAGKGGWTCDRFITYSPATWSQPVQQDN